MICKKVIISEKDLVQSLKSRSPIALEVLYDKYSNAISGILSKILNYQYVEDDLQEVILKIWNSIDQYDSEKGRLFTWILNLCRNYAIDILRSKSFRNNKKHIDIEGLQNYIEIKRPINFNIDCIGLRNLVCSLKPEFRAILILVYFNGYTHLEAAEELNMPLGTVKTRLRMAILELRGHFDVELSCIDNYT